MTRKGQRLFFVGVGGVAILFAGLLAWIALGEGTAYYYTPADIIANPPGTGRNLRVGGMVADGSLKKDGAIIRFEITDGQARVPAWFEGVPPDLFGENEGVVAEGRMGDDGVLAIRQIMAKHDENYMPKEVRDALEAGAAAGEKNDGR